MMRLHGCQDLTGSGHLPPIGKPASPKRRRRPRPKYVSRAEHGFRRAQWFKRRLQSEQNMVRAVGAIGKADAELRERASRRRDAAWLALEPDATQRAKWARQRAAKHRDPAALQTARLSSQALSASAEIVAKSTQIVGPQAVIHCLGVRNMATLERSRLHEADATAQQGMLAREAMARVLGRSVRRWRARLHQEAEELAAADARAKERSAFVQAHFNFEVADGNGLLKLPPAHK